MTYDGLEDDAKWPRPDRVHRNAALSGGIGGQAMEKIACVEFVAISDRERFESSIARHWRGKFVGGRRRVVRPHVSSPRLALSVLWNEASSAP
jgi:hypothetical protein